jgi:hypothetical protein
MRVLLTSTRSKLIDTDIFLKSAIGNGQVMSLGVPGFSALIVCAISRFKLFTASMPPRDTADQIRKLRPAE